MKRASHLAGSPRELDDHAPWSASILCVGRIGDGHYQGKKQQGHTNRAGEFCPHTRAVYQNLSAPINGVRPAVSSALRQITQRSRTCHCETTTPCESRSKVDEMAGPLACVAPRNCAEGFYNPLRHASRSKLSSCFLRTAVVDRPRNAQTPSESGPRNGRCCA